MRILLKNGIIFTQNPQREVIQHSDVLIQDSKIIDIGKNLSCSDIDEIIDMEGMWIVPGFINAHVHLGESIYAPFISPTLTIDKYLAQTDAIAASVKDIEKKRLLISQYSLIQVLKNGTTTIGGGRTSQASEQIGTRTVSAYMLMKSKKLGYLTEDFKKKIGDFLSETSLPLITKAIFIHSFNMVDRGIISETSRTLSENKLPFMIHIAEDLASKKETFKNWSKNEVDALEEASLLNERTILIHGNHLSEPDLDKIANAKSSLIHCLSSNMNSADATMDLHSVLKRNINVALATDGVVTSSSFSVFKEAANAFIYHNRFRGKIPIPASIFFDMITINAASALGLREKIGSIELGKEADIVILRPPFGEPNHNLIEHLIFYADLIDIKDVMVAGKFLVRDFKYTNNNFHRIEANFLKRVEDIRRKLN